jgi:hypothetical protein
MSAHAEFREAIRNLHMRKDAAYGNAWKRRGELISIIANIARKVDRLESVAGGAPPTEDESMLDTAVDLLVYCLKYQIYLADLDAVTAGRLISGRVDPPYSDGPEGFNILLADVDLTVFDVQPPPKAAACAAVVTIFNELELCVSTSIRASADERLACAANLAEAALRVVAALRHEAPMQLRKFVVTSQGGDH